MKLTARQIAECIRSVLREPRMKPLVVHVTGRKRAKFIREMLSEEERRMVRVHVPPSPGRQRANYVQRLMGPPAHPDPPDESPRRS